MAVQKFNAIHQHFEDHPMKKSGFTLMELVVYMAMIGIVVLVAGEAFSNSTRFRVRTQNMLKATEEAENVAALFKDDVSQMGAKSSKEAGNADGGESYGDKFSDVNVLVYMEPDNRDSSSFFVGQKNGFDSLALRRIRYDADGHYEAVEEISWFVDGEKLKRSCRLLSKKSGFSLADDDPCADVGSSPEAVEMAQTAVETFRVRPAKPSVENLENDEQIFPENNGNDFRLIPRNGESSGFNQIRKIENGEGSQNEGGSKQIISGFTSNYDPATGNTKSNVQANQVFAIKNESSALASEPWRSNCETYGKEFFRFNPHEEYEISFTVPAPTSTDDKSLMFVPGKDHFSVGFRNASDGNIPRKNGVALIQDFLFYPPLATEVDGKHAMRFTVSEPVENVCLAFTFVCYSPLASEGTLTIENLKVKRIANANYTFDNWNWNDANKKPLKQKVKAFQLDLVLKQRGETGNALLVVPTPGNGPTD